VGGGCCWTRRGAGARGSQSRMGLKKCHGRSKTEKQDKGGSLSRPGTCVHRGRFNISSMCYRLEERKGGRKNGAKAKSLPHGYSRRATPTGGIGVTKGGEKTLRQPVLHTLICLARIEGRKLAHWMVQREKDSGGGIWEPPSIHRHAQPDLGETPLTLQRPGREVAARRRNSRF